MSCSAVTIRILRSMTLVSILCRYICLSLIPTRIRVFSGWIALRFQFGSRSYRSVVFPVYLPHARGTFPEVCLRRHQYDIPNGCVGRLVSRPHGRLIRYRLLADTRWKLIHRRWFGFTMKACTSLDESTSQLCASFSWVLSKMVEAQCHSTPESRCAAT